MHYSRPRSNKCIIRQIAHMARTSGDENSPISGVMLQWSGVLGTDHIAEPLFPASLDLTSSTCCSQTSPYAYDHLSEYIACVHKDAMLSAGVRRLDRAAAVLQAAPAHVAAHMAAFRVLELARAAGYPRPPDLQPTRGARSRLCPWCRPLPLCKTCKMVSFSYAHPPSSCHFSLYETDCQPEA